MSPEPDVVTVRVTSEIDAAEARQEARRLALRHGFTTVRAHGLATAVSELAMNLVLHTDRGGLIRLTAQDATGAAVIDESVVADLLREARPGGGHDRHLVIVVDDIRSLSARTSPVRRLLAARPRAAAR